MCSLFGKRARILTEPVDWSITPVIASTLPSMLYSVPSISCNLIAGILLISSLIVPPVLVMANSSFSVMEKYTYTSSISETVVIGVEMEGLTNAPRRYGISLITPSEGLFTWVKERFCCAVVSCAFACASCACDCASVFSAIDKS